MLLHLPDGSARQLRQELDRLRALERGQGGAAVDADLVRARPVALSDDEGSDGLVAERIVQRDNGDVDHAGKLPYAAR